MHFSAELLWLWVIYSFFSVTKSFAWISFPWCFCGLSSAKALREYFVFPTSPSKINGPTVEYLKLQMTPRIPSLIREISPRIYTFKTAINRKTNIYVQTRAPGGSHYVTLSHIVPIRKSSDFMWHIYANLNTECIVWHGLKKVR